jgi:hypothetical protein
MFFDNIIRSLSAASDVNKLQQFHVTRFNSTEGSDHLSNPGTAAREAAAAEPLLRLDDLLGLMELGRAGVLAPANAAGGLEVLVDEVAALLVVVDALDPVAPAEALPDDLGGLDLDPLLPHQLKRSQ